MFCNLKTDHLGPKRLSNKAATRVKKKTAVAGSPKRITIEDSNEVDVPKGAEEEKRSHVTYPPKRNVTRANTSDQSKKQHTVIELSSDTTSSTTSDYKPTDNIEMKEEDQDSHISSVESEYERASPSSRKCKPKTTFSSRKTNRVTADESGKELPPSKSSKGKQPARVTGKRCSARHVPTSTAG